jgi:hypothetical protein
MTIMFFLASYLYTTYADEFDPGQGDMAQELLGGEGRDPGGEYLIFDDNGLSHISRESHGNKGKK